VEAVADCFAGQPRQVPFSYRLAGVPAAQLSLEAAIGFGNAELQLTAATLLANIQRVQARQLLPVSAQLDDFTRLDQRQQRTAVSAGYRAAALAAAGLHLDVEMETGTGKTYVYIKTMFELNRRYGWSKFIIIVPSVAIREGVFSALQQTAEHFHAQYGQRLRAAIYHSQRLHELEHFAQDAGITVLVMNMQAFNARGAQNRRIYEVLDDFQSRRPIDVIAATRPILILDEPQKMEGEATLAALAAFRPLLMLRYSATHRTQHLRIFRLDALDAYRQQLVKKIAVRGIQQRGGGGRSAYLYLEGIDISQAAPRARVELEVRRAAGEPARVRRRLAYRDDLYELSGRLEHYRGYVVSEIDALHERIAFTNGEVLQVGEARGDVNERDLRRIQIRETIRAHLVREQQLFARGIKVLSLFFIDAVVRYRDYTQPDEKGEYARMFEEEYTRLRDELLEQPLLLDDGYRGYLQRISAAATHNGYFAVDRRTNRLKDPSVAARTGDSDDVDAYELILRDKARLLALSEPTRFLFSHSALREGWDNPNIFVLCTLKHSDNSISRRQEIGRGLRLAVDQHGRRADQPATVHEINVLTVVANESYQDFVGGLQQELTLILNERPRRASAAYFAGRQLSGPAGELTITDEQAAQLYRYLVKHDYSDDADQLTARYQVERAAGRLAELPAALQPYAEAVFGLIDDLALRMPPVLNAATTQVNRLNANFQRREFQELWQRINRKAIYRVDFDSAELVQQAVAALNRELRISAAGYLIRSGEQAAATDDGAAATFELRDVRIEYGSSGAEAVDYDLIGKLAEQTRLTRRTAAAILSAIEPAVFAQFARAPERFISEAARLINEQQAAALIEHLRYDQLEERYDSTIYTAAQTGLDLRRATARLARHIYDYAIVDSAVEQRLIEDLECSSDVVVYAKLPRGFLIPTPVGDYNPDWAIAFRDGALQQLYFVAETKGSVASLALRGAEQAKIACARRFFAEINRRLAADDVRYGVVTDFGQLLELVRGNG
jgi:type III restriction enzyme